MGYTEDTVFFEEGGKSYYDGKQIKEKKPLCIGFGTENATKCGYDGDSFGYRSCGHFVENGQLSSTSSMKTFDEGDTITVAIDFTAKRAYFARNGKRIGSRPLDSLSRDLKGGKSLYPMVSFQDARIEFNFGAPRKPCKWLMDRGFVSLEQMTNGEDDRKMVENEENVADSDSESVHSVDWHSEGVIDELWLWIFECLEPAEVVRAQRVCTKWWSLIAKYNVAERHEMGCYFSKSRLTESGCTEIMGIGLEIKPNDSGFGVSVLSQMDILSKSAWRSGCHIGVWGENLTHFLPMVMDRRHSERAHEDIIHFLGIISRDIRWCTVISNPNELEKEIANNATLKLVDSLISMMNSIVVQFVMKNDAEMKALRKSSRNYDDAMKGSKSITMMMCEKVVIGYSAFHHLLLYLQSKNRKLITSFADRTVALFMAKVASNGKSVCKDLGKLLIWTMISSKYRWRDIAKQFVVEVMTRNVKWMVKQTQYRCYDTSSPNPCFPAQLPVSGHGRSRVCSVSLKSSWSQHFDCTKHFTVHFTS